MDPLADYAAYDKARRPYTVIDAYSPGGTWIEEKRFNRRPANAEGGGRVLFGNWLEEEALAAEKRREGKVEEDTRLSASPFLTQDARGLARRTFETTAGRDFNAANADVRALRRPEYGVRTRLLLGQAVAMAAAEAAQKREEAASAGGGASGVRKGPARPPPVERLRQDYAREAAITLYSGVPGSTRGPMAVLGKTSGGPAGHARCSNFSDPKYHL